METIFKDLLVVELANVLAGPSTGMFFAELGARVIKVENKGTGGDLTRNWKLPQEDASATVSAYYASVNWGKESHLLDLKNDKDRAQVYEWIKKADIVISNFRPKEAERMGMTYEELYKYNEKIIFGHLSGYGEKDERAAFDLVLQAETGYMAMNGTGGSGPIKMPVAFIDLLAGHQLKEALLVALIRRLQTGKGSAVSISLYDAAVSSLANQATNYLQCGMIPGLKGSLHPNIAPYGETLLCSDNKWLVLAVGNDKQFIALCKVLTIPELAKDRRFDSNPNRVRTRIDLLKDLQNAAGKWVSEDLKTALDIAGVPCGLIKNLEEVFADSKAKALIMNEFREGASLRCVKSVVFRLKSPQ